MRAHLIPRTTQITMTPKGEPIFSENAFVIAIVDEAGGEFIQVSNAGERPLRFDKNDWPALRSTINRMVKMIREET